MTLEKTMTLVEWLKETKRTQTKLAEELGLTRSYVSLLCKPKDDPSRRLPSAQVAYAIEALSDGKVLARDLLLDGEDPLELCRRRAA
jgi:transcriptional regulator with XRE-family HTH domain